MTVGQYVYSIRKFLFHIDSGSNREMADGRIPYPPEIASEAIPFLENLLELEFDTEETAAGNVCMANAGELLPEFRTTFSGTHLLDYIYAVIHASSHIEKYPELPKTGPTPVPCPRDSTNFWQLVQLGHSLRTLHLSPNISIADPAFRFPIEGSKPSIREMTTVSPRYEATGPSTGRVWINDKQFFDQVPKQVWQFSLGGYLPAHECLKERGNRQLTNQEILHFRALLHILEETLILQEKIDATGVEQEKEFLV